MHIIYFDRHNSSHTIKISKTGKYGFILTIIASLFLCGYFGYYFGINRNLDYKAQNLWIHDWRTELNEKQEAIDTFKQDVKINLSAFSEQMAKQQAHIARLDALAMHIGNVAKIDSSLFNFNEKLTEEDLYSNDSESTTDNTEHEYSVEFMRVFDILSNNISVLDNQLHLLQSILKYQKLDKQILVKGKPVKYGYISSYYGYRNHPIKKRQILHRGIDFVNKKGTPILSVASGIVSYAGKRGGYGNLVEVNHGDGYFTRYAHNNEVTVKVGDLINRGDQIALMGNTGRSTGTHVHFEVWKNGRPENPIRYLSRK